MRDRSELQGAVVVGASLAGLRAVETLRTDGFEGPDHAGRRRGPPPVRPAAAVEEGAVRRVGARADRPAQGRRAGRARRGRCGSASAPSGSTSAARRVDLERRDRARLRRPGHRHRRRGAPAARPARPRRRSSCCAPWTTAWPCGPRSRPGSPRVVVIGAGFIGAEVAATARGLGCDVTVVEALPVPLARALGPADGHGLRRAPPGPRRRRCGSASAWTPSRALAGWSGSGPHRRHRSWRPTSSWSASAWRRPPAGWGQRARAARRGGVRRHAGRRAARGLRRRRRLRWPNRCSARRCGSSTGPTPPSRARTRPATCWPRRPAEPGAPYAPVPFFWSDQYGARHPVPRPGRARRRGAGRQRVGRGAAPSSPCTAATAACGACSGSRRPKLVMPYQKLLAGAASAGTTPSRTPHAVGRMAELAHDHEPVRLNVML